MKNIRDEQHMIEELRELPDFQLRAEKREEMRTMIEYGVERRKRVSKWKVATGSFAGVAVAAVLALVMVNHFNADQTKFVPGSGRSVQHPTQQSQYVTHLTYAVQSGNRMLSTAEMHQEAQALTQRLVALGVQSPNVQVEAGTSRLVVDLPKVNDLTGVQKAIESQGSMEIRNGSGQVVATSADLKQNAKVVHDAQTGTLQVSFEFKDPKKWEDITKANLQRQISIYFNGTLKSSPVVQTVMTDGKSVISGNFSEAEANAVVAAINATPLTYPLLQVEQ